eukprot:919262-Rhodomonas_salina.1
MEHLTIVFAVNMANQAFIPSFDLGLLAHCTVGGGIVNRSTAEARERGFILVPDVERRRAFPAVDKRVSVAQKPFRVQKPRLQFTESPSEPVHRTVSAARPVHRIEPAERREWPRRLAISGSVTSACLGHAGQRLLSLPPSLSLLQADILTETH